MSLEENLDGEGITKDVLETTPDVNLSTKQTILDAKLNIPFIKAPTKQYALYYNMDHQKRGRAIIFNHEKFHDKSLEIRIGNGNEIENIRDTLASLGFIVEEYQNFTSKEIKMTLKRVANEDYRNHDCLVICILTYGSLGILHAYDETYKADLVWSYFTSDKCDTLSGKPKLFFIQTWEQKKVIANSAPISRKHTESDASESNRRTFRLPNHADFLIAYSMMSHPFEWNESLHGPWFIKVLCKVLNQFGTQYDLLTLLTAVFRYVHEQYNCSPREIALNKEITYVTSMLTRLVKFKAAKGDIEN